MRRDLVALIAEIELRRHLSHSWSGGRDCVGFALACVKAQTGIDHLADLPTWTSRREARAVAQSVGGLQAMLDERFNRVAPAMAQRGDIAGLPDAVFGVRLMIVEGVNLVGPGLAGLERLPRDAMTVAWSAIP